MSLARWVIQASREPVIFLPRVEPHPAGSILGGLGFALGVAATQWSFAGQQILAWVSLAMVLVGMVLHWRWKKANAGWRVRFADRRLEPVGLRGEPIVLSGEGWSIQVGPGDRRANIAIDLRHEHRGRQARLLDKPARGKSDTTNLDQLADRLAQRLEIPRTGLRL